MFNADIVTTEYIIEFINNNIKFEAGNGWSNINECDELIDWFKERKEDEQYIAETNGIIKQLNFNEEQMKYKKNDHVNLWDYCLKSNEWKVVLPDQQITHIVLDIDIMLEYYWNYNILFNFNAKEEFNVKLIEKKLTIDEQIRLLTMFIDIYGKIRK